MTIGGKRRKDRARWEERAEGAEGAERAERARRASRNSRKSQCSLAEILFTLGEKKLHLRVELCLAKVLPQATSWLRFQVRLTQHLCYFDASLESEFESQFEQPDEEEGKEESEKLNILKLKLLN